MRPLHLYLSSLLLAGSVLTLAAVLWLRSPRYQLQGVGDGQALILDNWTGQLEIRFNYGGEVRQRRLGRLAVETVETFD